MTNTQAVEEQPAEQPQEEVQLTELRPVEHSRLRGADERDATDGLKALRSFSRRQIDEFEQFGSGYPRKRKASRWRHLHEADEFGIDSGDEDCPKKRLVQPRLSKAAGSDGVDSDEFVEEEDDDDEYYGVNGDFEYLDDKSDEIYVYRQQEACPSPEVEKGTVKEVDRQLEKKVESKSVEVPRRPRGRPRKKRKGARSKKSEASDKVASKEPVSESALDESANELRSKINDLIEANMLLEQENNNVLESGKLDSRLEEEEEEEAKGLAEEAQTKKYSCDLCEARFKGSGGLRNHYKVVHSRGPLFRCDECGKEFPLKERLKLHVRTHTGFKPYKCPECDKSFARGGQLVQHRRTHSQVKPYRCELCAGTFTCAANLALHVKRHSGQKDHKCEICGRGFVRRDALKKHLECLHRDVKSFLCVICNKTFKGHLPQHMRTHAQDRPHGCATCGQRFAQKSQLTVHQRTHSGQRPFRCLVCWQAFAHSTALKLHTRRHTGERPFKCAECSAGFTQLPHWKKHMKCIHGRSEPYSCRGCNSFFRIKSELESHEKDCSGGQSTESNQSADETSGSPSAYRSMSIERMRLLLAVLLKRISKPERLHELGFGKRLIDEVLVDSLLAAGKQARRPPATPEIEALRGNLAVFLEWTVPKEHWEAFRKMNKTPEEVLETLTAT